MQVEEDPLCAWYAKIIGYLLRGFTKNEADPNLYCVLVEHESVIFILYVDNLFLTGWEKLIGMCKEDLSLKFKMDISLMQYFLGLEVWQQRGDNFLRQGKYAIETLRRFKTEDCRLMFKSMITNLEKLIASEGELVDPTLYRHLIGSMMYLVNTRLDICFVVNALSRFMVEPRQVHWVVAKHVLKYLQRTMDSGMRYVRCGVKLQRYRNSDCVGSVVGKKSMSRCCSSLGPAMISWYNRKQQSVALSSVEVEYMVVSMASCEAVWLPKMLAILYDL